MFSGCPQSDIIVTDYFWACWTLPTCSNMPYSTFVPTIVCLVWPLEASRGPDEPKYVFLGCPRVILSWLITSGHVGRFQPVPICHTQLLFLPLSVWFDLYRPLEVSRGPNEPKCVFSGRSQSDIIVMYHSWARVGPPTTSGEVSRPLWTKSDLLTLPRR